MTDHKPVFIEKIMPVKLLNAQVYYENEGNPFKGLHRWYSRKPLSFSRASVLGSLLPADISMEEFEYLLGLDRAKANESDVEIINEAKVRIREELGEEKLQAIATYLNAPHHGLSVFIRRPTSSPTGLRLA